jgi:hypothetical protein
MGKFHVNTLCDHIVQGWLVVSSIYSMAILHFFVTKIPVLIERERIHIICGGYCSDLWTVILSVMDLF